MGVQKKKIKDTAKDDRGQAPRPKRNNTPFPRDEPKGKEKLSGKEKKFKMKG